MTTTPRLLGVFRERAHSPGRETDDEQILLAVAHALEARGHAVDLVGPEELDSALDDARFALAFYMCERQSVLNLLARAETRGSILLNRLEGVRNTFRHRMIPLLRRLGDAFPKSRIVPTENGAQESSGIWVKRGDFHQTQDGDVTFAPDAAAVGRALAALGARGVPTAVLQDHVDGDIVKFYGVGTSSGDWFHCFYHRDQELRGTPYDLEELQALARRAAELLRLDVYGGDVIVGTDGRLSVIDVNAWPSFALVREEAAEHIASLIDRRVAALGPEAAGGVASREGEKT